MIHYLTTFLVEAQRAEFVNIVDHCNYIMMVKSIYTLNEPRGKLEDVEKKEHELEILEWVEVLVTTLLDRYDIL